MKIYKIFIILLAIFSPIFSFAQIVINEIMYDLSGSDTGREWVEIYNSGGATVDISGWKFLESSNASNHGLTLIQGQSVLSGGSFAVIVNDSTRFLLDYPSFLGNILKASFSINNTGETVYIKDSDLNIIDQVPYTSNQGANGDGNSLQKENGNWVAKTPTPGSISMINSSATMTATTTATETVNTTTSTSSIPSSSGVSSAHSSPAPISQTEEKISLEVSAGRDRLTAIGNSITFKAVVTKADEVSPQNLSYAWSFGDGTTGQGSVVSHAYKFSGEYTVILNASFSDKLAVSRIRVTVTSPVFSMKRYDEGLEITNMGKEEVNLEDWSIVSFKKTFVFPRDTIIPPRRAVIFPDEVTNIKEEGVELLNPLGRQFGSIKKSETNKNGDIGISTTTVLSLRDIEIKIKDIERELISISQKTKNTQPIQPPSLTTIDRPLKSEEKMDTTVSVDQLANTIELFEAEKKIGIINKIFNWPIKSINWIQGLFVEK